MKRNKQTNKQETNRVDINTSYWLVWSDQTTNERRYTVNEAYFGFVKEVQESLLPSSLFANQQDFDHPWDGFRCCEKSEVWTPTLRKKQNEKWFSCWGIASHILTCSPQKKCALTTFFLPLSGPRCGLVLLLSFRSVLVGSTGGFAVSSPSTLQIGPSIGMHRVPEVCAVPSHWARSKSDLPMTSKANTWRSGYCKRLRVIQNHPGTQHLPDFPQNSLKPTPISNIKHPLNQPTRTTKHNPCAKFLDCSPPVVWSWGSRARRPWCTENPRLLLQWPWLLDRTPSVNRKWQRRPRWLPKMWWERADLNQKLWKKNRHRRKTFRNEAKSSEVATNPLVAKRIIKCPEIRWIWWSSMIRCSPESLVWRVALQLDKTMIEIPLVLTPPKMFGFLWWYSGWWFEPLWKIWKSVGIMKF